jgi:hypothetical protein
MADSEPRLRWAAKIRAATAFCLAGAVAGTGLYFGNLSYVKASDDAGRAASTSPILVTVGRSDVPGCQEWLFPNSIQDIPYASSLNSQDAATDEEWALRNGASDVNGGAYTITLLGTSAAENVVILGIRVKRSFHRCRRGKAR